MKHGVIAGPYVPLYPEVARKLAGVKRFSARWVYIALLTLFPAEEDWGYDPVWVSAIIRATKTDIARESGVSYSGFNRLWKQLIEAGLVSIGEDGSIVIPFYKKKAYDSISATEVRERFSRNEAVIAELKANIEENQGNPGQQGSKPPQKEEDHPQKEEDHPQKEEDHPQKEDTLILLKGLKKKPLSREKLISWFYGEIGQTRISDSEREKARKIYRNLRADGFSVREIDFASQWTIENAKEKPRTFGLISNTIGQAMEALKSGQEKAKRVEEELRLVDEARAERETQAKDTERMDALKDGMTPRKRENLREEAVRELKETPGITEGFISEPLIKAKENEIVKRLVEEG